MAPVREALDHFLEAHLPYPAAVVDRHWNLVAANEGIDRLTEGVAPELLEPPANALRIALTPREWLPGFSTSPSGAGTSWSAWGAKPH
jgi:MmyB-like transcription regulator ligand binding domain